MYRDPRVNGWKLSPSLPMLTFHKEWIYDIMMHQLEIRMADPMFDVSLSTGIVVIQDDNFVTVFHKAID